MDPMRRSAAVLIAILCLHSAALAGVNSATQAQIEKDLLSRSFVAKVDLYQAKLVEGAQVVSEKDDEAIRVGFPIIIDRVTFSSKTIRIRMKHPRVNEVTYVDFIFQQPLSADFGKERDAFEKMLATVFEEKKRDE